MDRNASLIAALWGIVLNSSNTDFPSELQKGAFFFKGAIFLKELFFLKAALL